MKFYHDYWILRLGLYSYMRLPPPNHHFGIVIVTSSKSTKTVAPLCRTINYK